MRELHTLNEFQENLTFNLLNIEKSCKNLESSIELLGDMMPVGLLINHRNGKNLYMNNASCKILNFTLEEIEYLGKSYASTIIFDEQEMHRILPLIDHFYEKCDTSDVLSFFQKVRPQRKDDYEWVYITSKLLKRENKTIPDRRLLVACPVNMMGNMSNKITRALDENAYMKKNFKYFAALTKREKEILILAAQGLENPKIADQLFISRHTVEQHRKNIRSKTGIRSVAELIKFAQAFDLIDY